MRTRTLTTTGLLVAGLLLTACSSTPNSTPDRTATAPSVKATAKAAATVDCSDPTLSQPPGSVDSGGCGHPSPLGGLFAAAPPQSSTRIEAMSAM